MSRTAPEGFTEFVVARSTSLHRTAVLLTHDETSAEDLVQTALVKACRSWHQKQSGHEAYVRRIMVNEFATRWRRRWQSEQPFAAVPQAVSPDPSDGVSIHQMVLAALAALPPRQRAIVVLRFFHDYTEPMAAETLGISVGTVRSQTARALAALGISEQPGEAPDAQPVPPRGGPWS